MHVLLFRNEVINYSGIPIYPSAICIRKCQAHQRRPTKHQSDHACRNCFRYLVSGKVFEFLKPIDEVAIEEAIVIPINRNV
jgi:hypothetical protein